MRAGEAFWSGREEAFACAIDALVPNELKLNVEEAYVKTGRFREGHAFKASVIEAWEKGLGPYSWTWRTTMEAKVAASECADRATEAVQRLDGVIKSFRQNLKNDTASMKAASDRVQSEVLQMSEKYRQAQQLLTSPDFERAIANAERMATALKAISELSDTKLSVAVFGGGKATN